MKYLSPLLLIISCSLSFAQVSDDFSDGNFSTNPVWSGQTSHFDATALNLHLNAPATQSTSYLSVPQTQLGNTTWAFLVNLGFATSSSSLTKIYLTSDQADLSGSLNGYYVMVGNSTDEISLYRQSGTSSSYVINGADKLIESSSVNVRIRVARDELGNWSLYHDILGGTSYSQEGGSVLDVTHTSSSFFGVFCKYIASRSTKFYFDDISVSTPISGFSVASLTKETSNQIRITFDQDVDKSTAETPSNYRLNYGFGNPLSVVRDASNNNEILLTFSSNFANNSYALNINNIKNLTLDETIIDQNQGIKIEIQTPFRNIVINEIFADPSPSVDLPVSEFLELYNPSGESINLEGFVVDGKILSDYVLNPNSYVILTEVGDISDYLSYGDVIGLASTWSLTNGGESLNLTDNLGNLVDSVTFDLKWYRDVSKDGGGYSIEQINPELACNYINNWTASAHIDGGTPGSENDIYDNSPDTTEPNLIDFIAADQSTFKLTFDEPMDENSINGGSYSFDHGIGENGITAISPGFFSVLVGTNIDLTSGTTYTIVISGSTDCAGNTINTNSLSYTYDTSPPQLDRLIVKSNTELKLVFDEELKESIAEMASNFTVDNSVGFPNSSTLDESDPSILNLTFNQEFTLDVENLLTIINLQDIHGNVLIAPIIEPFMLSQNIDTLLVTGINFIDLLFMSSLDPASSSVLGNYAVNREIGSPVSAFIDGKNDRLLHLAFTENFSGGVYMLSIENLEDLDNNPLTTPNIEFFYDTSSPKVSSVNVLSENSLEVVFLEKIDQQSAESKENYKYGDDIFPVEAILSKNQQSVYLTYNENFEREVEYELSVDEVKDLYGNEIKTKIKVPFVYDIFSPELDSIIVRSPDELILIFNEKLDRVSAETTSNYLVSDGVGIPAVTKQDLEFENIIFLTLASPIPEGSKIDLTTSNLIDQRDNALETSINKRFSYDQFALSMIAPINRNSIEIEFNKNPELASKSILSNYQIEDSNVVQITFSKLRKAIITVSEPFQDDNIYSLSLKNVRDENLNALSKNEYQFTFHSRLKSSKLINDRTIQLEFELALDQNQVFDLVSFTTLPTLGNCTSVILDMDKPELLRLTFEEKVKPNVEYIISWGNLENVFQNRLPDYFTSLIDDQMPPSAMQHIVVDQNTIWVKFSEPLNGVSAEHLNNYHVPSDIGFPAEVKYSHSDSSVLIDFEAQFEDGDTYTITVDNIEDLSDNALLGHQITFQYQAPYIPVFGDIIITEIMSDPTPSVGLPEVEYLEFYNTTDQLIKLGGLSLFDASSSTTIVSGEIGPKEYLVVTSSANANKFGDINVLGMSGFISLNNNGEDIGLATVDNPIFTTRYRSNWYKDSDKSEGGWSLEMIDVNNPCGEKNNWTASENEIGGTPGFPNSVATDNPDNFGPKLEAVVAENPLTLVLTFDEIIHPGSSFSFEIKPNLGVSSSKLDLSGRKLTITLQGQLTSKQTYEITITGAIDCKQNLVQTEFNKLEVTLPENAVTSDIIINEVLFNPRTGGADFVELYNKSTKTINLKNWKLGDKLSAMHLLSEDYIILNPEEYLVLTLDSDILFTNYPRGNTSVFMKMNSFPGLANDEDSVILLNNFDKVIDEMIYMDDYHFNLLSDEKGVSLERISFDVESLNSDSWQSAASTVGFATPGLINSQFKSENQSTAIVSIHPKAFVPDNTGVNDYTTINYQLDQSGNFANVQILSASGIPTRTLAEGELLSTSGFFIWDGTTDNGQRASVGYYVVYFELFDQMGNKSTIKETVALGAKF